MWVIQVLVLYWIIQRVATTLIYENDWPYMVYATRCWFIRMPGRRHTCFRCLLRTFRLRSYVSPLSSIKTSNRLIYIDYYLRKKS